MPEVLLDRSQVPMSPTKQLDAARVAERMWMELGDACLFPEGLDELEHTMIPHALFSGSTSLGSEPHDEKRVVRGRTMSLCVYILRQDSAGNLR